MEAVFKVAESSLARILSREANLGKLGLEWRASVLIEVQRQMKGLLWNIDVIREARRLLLCPLPYLPRFKCAANYFYFTLPHRLARCRESLEARETR